MLQVVGLLCFVAACPSQLVIPDIGPLPPFWEKTIDQLLALEEKYGDSSEEDSSSSEEDSSSDSSDSSEEDGGAQESDAVPTSEAPQNPATAESCSY